MFSIVCASGGSSKIDVRLQRLLGSILIAEFSDRPDKFNFINVACRRIYSFPAPIHLADGRRARCNLRAQIPLHLVRRSNQWRLPLVFIVFDIRNEYFRIKNGRRCCMPVEMLLSSNGQIHCESIFETRWPTDRIASTTTMRMQSFHPSPWRLKVCLQVTYQRILLTIHGWFCWKPSPSPFLWAVPGSTIVKLVKRWSEKQTDTLYWKYSAPWRSSRDFTHKMNIDINNYVLARIISSKSVSVYNRHRKWTSLYVSFSHFGAMIFGSQDLYIIEKSSFVSFLENKLIYESNVSANSRFVPSEVDSVSLHL